MVSFGLDVKVNGIEYMACLEATIERVNNLPYILLL